MKLKPIKQESARLDLNDKKILYQLDINTRQTASDIGKKVGLSKQVVAYRINQLIKTGVIQKFYAIYDTSKLGYTTYKILIRLQNVNIEKQNEIIEYIKNNKNVQFFITTDGMFDMVFNVLARSGIELYDIIKEFENKYGNYIAEKQMIVMIFASFFFRDYLIEKKSNEIRKPIHFGSREEVEIDETNKKILGLLGMDARMPVVDIAKKIEISADAVAIRIKKLEKAQIIQNYCLLPDFSLMGQTSYKILFSLHNLTEERENALLEYCRQQPNIWFHNKALGLWDLEINMDVDNAAQFRQIMMEIKSQFSDIIKEYTTLQVSKVEKFNFYPMG